MDDSNRAFFLLQELGPGAFRRELGRRMAVFWRSPDRWQIDLPDYVFAARAVHQLGASLFDRWPEDNILAGKDLRYFTEVTKKVRENCVWGRIHAFGMMADGRMAPILAHRWRTEKYRMWMADCLIPSGDADPEDPRDGVGRQEWPLYFGREGFERLIAAAGQTANFSVAAHPPAPHGNDVKALFDAVVKLWRGHDESPRYRVTRDGFEELCKLRFGVSAGEDARLVFEEHRPAAWARPGRFPGKRPALKIWEELRGEL